MKRAIDKDNLPLASDFLESTASLDDESFITEIYCTYLLREPDENGKQGYLQHISQGQLTREQMVDGFQNSPEFELVWQSKAEIERRQKTLLIKENLRSVEPPIPGNKEFLASTAELSDRLFVTAVYRTFLLREPDAGGFKGQTQYLRKGQVTREQILSEIQNSPEFESVWKSVAAVRQRQKILLEQQQQQKEALAICQEALKLYQESPSKNNSTENDPELSRKATEIAEVYYQKAVDLAQNKQLSAAIAHWEKAVELKPDFAQAWGELGDALLKVGQVSRGIDCYHQALNLQPEFVNAYKKWADSRIQEGKDDGIFLEKNADFLKALQTKPHSVSVYKYLGEILAADMNFVGAIYAYEQAIKLESDRAELGEIYINFGKVLADNYEFDRAVLAYKKAIELTTEDSEISFIYLELGKTLAAQKNWDEAIEAYHQALEINQYLGQAYLYLAKTLVKKERIEEALSNYRKAIEYSSSNADSIKQEMLSLFAVSAESYSISSEFLNQNLLSPSNTVSGYYYFSYDWVIQSNHKDSKYIQVTPSQEMEILPIRYLEEEVDFLIEFGYEMDRDFMKFQTNINYIKIPETFVVTIASGRYVNVDGVVSAVIAPDGKLLGDISYAGHGILTREHPMVLGKQTKLKPQIYLEGKVAVFSCFAMANYYHWFFETLPRINILELSGIKLTEIDKFLIDDNLQFQKETLEILGVPSSKIIDVNNYSNIKAELLIVPSYQGVYGIPTKESCDLIRKKFLPLASPEKFSRLKRIYISRQYTSVRRLINEEEVLAVLKPLGFTCIFPEKMSLPDQISLFASAEVIIGVWGAWATNLVFCNPGTKVIGFLRDTKPLPFHSICQYLNIEDYCLKTTILPIEYLWHLVALGPRGLPYFYSDMLVNIDSLKEMLNLAKIS